jgi:hypothetical protein
MICSFFDFVLFFKNAVGAGVDTMFVSPAYVHIIINSSADMAVSVFCPEDERSSNFL